MNYREILIRLMSMTSPFVYDSEESFLEMLRKFYKYLHELTEATKKMSDDIIDIKKDITSLQEEIDNEIDKINDILIEYNLKIDRISNELHVYVDGEITNLRNYVDSKDSYLEEKIRKIEIGKINIYDPTTGLYSPLQTVINNLYDTQRDNSLTASEYDTLELTATAYDEYELTAREYDINAKNILV